MKTFPVIRVIVGAGVIVVALAIGNLRSPQTAGHAIPVVRADSGADSDCTFATLNGPYAVSRQGTLLTSVLGLPAPAPGAKSRELFLTGPDRFPAAQR